MTTEDTENTEGATPETDACWRDMHTGNSQPSWWVAAHRMRDHAKRLERERDKAIRQRNETNESSKYAVDYAICERDEARADAAKIADILSGLELRSTEEMARLEQERNEALAQIKELMYIGERAIALAEIDFENDKFGVVSELRDDLAKIKKSK